MEGIHKNLYEISQQQQILNVEEEEEIGDDDNEFKILKEEFQKDLSEIESGKALCVDAIPNKTGERQILPKTKCREKETSQDTAQNGTLRDAIEGRKGRDRKRIQLLGSFKEDKSYAVQKGNWKIRMTGENLT